MNKPAPRWYHRLYVALQYPLPQHLLSALMFRITRVRWAPFKDLIIRLFVRHFRVDMGEAEQSDPASFPSFNAFFTRALRPGARPVGDGQDTLSCPADGALSQLGAIDGGRIFQAKGLGYSLEELLGGERNWSARFIGGSFATVYLSPRDYHRVHMPLSGTLQSMRHLPGRLFSVNRITTRLVPRLFARNERVVCLFDGDLGPFALILVGAIFVGSIETVWAGQVTPARQACGSSQGGGEAVQLPQGAEMGRFNMGSTVILLFPPGMVAWEPGLHAGDRLHMGQALGRTSRAQEKG